ncbi:stimulator of interferon genes protein isoform X3 [Coccinella septempunctata]|uniref:stimulator of interferon genes protein isoform X3 n=1 Tax=Coccinella septempunctata TaxID=41139 RepID=UPI001D07B03E|nr:stimulator of interferon genes protein isoform X3 [Coccinella septempunctata]
MPPTGSSSRKSSNDWKTYVVADKGGRLKFPSTIPKVRSKLTEKLVIFFMILSLYCTFYLNDFDEICLEAISYGVLIFYAMEALYRLILSFEELLNHFMPRYQNSIRHLFNSFIFTRESCFVATMFAIVEWYFYNKHGLIDLNKLDRRSFFSIALFVWFLGKVTRVEQASIYNSLRFEEDDGLNYSSAMAHSFFHGYLRLILPKTGGQDKNLIEIIEVYSDKHNVQVFPKLFILVPKSAVCPVSLEGTNIHLSSSLEEKQLTIAGVQKRVYKNSVYKVRDPQNPKQPNYVCAEYATPLRTFFKALEASGKYNENFKKHQDDIVLHFYLTTRDLVMNDPDISNLCELIYYDDRDEKGNFRDVAPILLRKIRKRL